MKRSTRSRSAKDRRTCWRRKQRLSVVVRAVVNESVLGDCSRALRCTVTDSTTANRVNTLAKELFGLNLKEPTL